jgi:hypothetical protein
MQADGSTYDPIDGHQYHMGGEGLTPGPSISTTLVSGFIQSYQYRVLIVATVWHPLLSFLYLRRRSRRFFFLRRSSFFFFSSL